MLVTAVDHEPNLFQVQQAVSTDLANRILATDWAQLKYQRQEGQESWKRRRIIDAELPWIDQWHSEIQLAWPILEQCMGIQLHPYFGTAWWVDEPGFTCGMHTDGEMPGSLHLVWQGPGTAFYWFKQQNSLRWQCPSMANAGYVMINQPDADGSRTLLWHAMLDECRDFRVTSYTWIQPR